MMPRVFVTLVAAALLLIQAPAEAARAGKPKAPRVEVRTHPAAAKPARTTRLARTGSRLPRIAAAATTAVGAGALAAAAPVTKRDGVAEARLIEIYRLIGQARNREALDRAEQLVKDHPNFQLAQLVYGDLLASRARALKRMGDVPDTVAISAASTLSDLREESLQRLRALRERPPPGTIPAPFLQLSSRTRHAVAVDASRSRLYLFENTATGLTLLADYYISVGKLGVEKQVEGDQRTPLGVYYITSNLDPRTLKDFYGSGALPINYPNPLDLSRGKTGSGIWLHGTPPQQFSRAPKASDGCVVLANPDLERIIRTVEVRTTPVVIAHQLRWVAPHSHAVERKAFESELQAWRQAKSSGSLERLVAHYHPDFRVNGKSLKDWLPVLRDDLSKARGRDLELKDVSMLRWTDAADTMVVTFGEVPRGERSGVTRRQYWIRHGAQWKIFFEGVLG